MPTAPTPQEREQQLSLWVAQALKCAPESIQLKSIASDAGFRRYFRFQTPSQWLAVDAPPQTEDSRQFVALARYLSEHKVHTPKILAADDAQGFLLVEDFGDELLHRQLTPGTAAQLYRQTFKSLLSLQACPDQTTLIPRYDRALLRRELEIFSEWFVEKLLGYQLNPAELELLNSLFSRLENAALEQPQTLVHRDFHSRNLIIRADGTLGVIDFQGALWGGCTYDLVSLLRDCYISWPAALVKGLALEYREAAINAQLLDDSIDEAQYLRWFDWLGLQRHIKVLGIFARLNLRDNKPHYLKDLPLVIRYTLDIANSYPELEPFADWFSANLLPLAEQQSWYSGYSHAGDN
ncbi:phosphotransferase [Cellvibrio zantedeschiae]|uniref:Phosphotransferase n=1 Tax=Cellvibrio zantedeschiae TaxID=1237077 RepID=A0ABQ3B5N0_9GAMM|nr:phosphotransferase [Cellvibrio zantedeschiae]GGY80738.1 phosphotransferase [Cellvibrio zantedeschiae]